MGALSRLALVVRAASQRVAHADPLDHKRFVFQVGPARSLAQPMSNTVSGVDRDAGPGLDRLEKLQRITPP